MMSDKQKNQILLCIRELVDRMGYLANVSWNEQSTHGIATPVITIESADNLSLLIGGDGKNLEAFEHVAHLVARRAVASEDKESMYFMLDINNYRVAQMARLVAAAKESAEHVMATGRPESLAPMTSYQRRIVHSELSSFHSVETESIGEEPNRRIVIKPAPFSSGRTVHEGLDGSF